MIVTLIGQNVLYKTKLPQNAIGNYWIIDENGKKIISIEGQGKDWEIESNNRVKIINPQSLTSFNVSKIAQKKENILERTKLKEYEMNYVYIKDFSNNVFVLYCAPNFEKDYTHLNIKNSQEILIGRDQGCDIKYNFPLVGKKQARIFYSNGKLMLENLDTNFGTFVNNNPVTQKLKMLFNGDIIFIMGLKIIIIGRSIYINNPFNRVSCSNEVFEINKMNIEILDIEEDDESNIELYSEKDYFSRAPRITNKIEREKIKIDPPPQSNNKEGVPLILVLGTSLSMGIIMIVSMISTFDRLQSGSSTFKDAMFSVITSLAILISIILFPLLNRKYEKKQKNKYEEKRQKRYKDYINSKISLIDGIMKKQKEILYENYISAEECAKIVVNKGSRLW